MNYKFLITALCFLPETVFASVTISPQSILLKPNSRTAEVIVVNTKNTKEVFRLSLVDKMMKSDGSLIDKSYKDSGKDYVFITPRKVTLNGKGTQIVRVMLKGHKNLQDGEYKTHLTLRHVPQNINILDDDNIDGLKMSLTPRYGVSIPVFIKIGKRKINVSIENVKVIDSEAKFKLTRAGDHSLRGKINIYQKNTLVGNIKNVAIYRSLEVRDFSVPLNNKFKNGIPIRVEFIDEYTKEKITQ